MTSHLNDGDCVVQILACEQDPSRLFDDIANHVAADRAKHAAVYEARVVIEAPNTGSHHQQDGPTRRPIALPSVYLGRSGLTLTLLHMDTTFRFEGACIKNSSPGLAWPTIHQSFAANTFVDDDLILRAQYHHPGASLKPGKQHIMTSPSLALLTFLRCCSWSLAPACRDSHPRPCRRHPTRAGGIVQDYAVPLVQTAPFLARPCEIPQDRRWHPRRTHARIRSPAVSRDDQNATERHYTAPRVGRSSGRDLYPLV